MDTVRFSKIVDEILESLPQHFKDHFNNLAFIDTVWDRPSWPLKGNPTKILWSSSRII